MITDVRLNFGKPSSIFMFKGGSMDMLGKKAKDKLTGFEGTVIAVTNYLWGCVRVGIQPTKLTKEGKMQEEQWFDDDRVEVLGESNYEKRKKGNTGGTERDPHVSYKQ